MIVQLNPPLPLNTDKGPALAHLVIDYGPEHDLLWVCFLENSEIWCLSNKQVRATKNITYERPKSKDDKPITLDDIIEVAQKNRGHYLLSNASVYIKDATWQLCNELVCSGRARWLKVRTSGSEGIGEPGPGIKLIGD